MSNNNWHWTDDLSIGIEEIDNDHKVLFSILNNAYQLMNKDNNKAELYYLATQLVGYTQTHFKREEAVMSACSYPLYESHLTTHKKLLEQVKNTLNQIEHNEQPINEFVTFLQKWLIKHIKGIDQKLITYTVGYEDQITKALEVAGPLVLKQTPHIYFVDDDDAYLQLLQLIATNEILLSSSYNSGEVFLTAPVTDCDLIVLDLNMPDKDGIEVMRELTKQQISPTMILISGFDERVLHSAKQFAESKQLKVAATLTKPFNLNQFSNLLTTAYNNCKSIPLIKTKQAAINSPEQITVDNAEVTVNEFQAAINNNEFIIYVQPQITFSGNIIAGVEALVRWQHPTRGLLTPNYFIPLAEKHHLMAKLTEQVLIASIKAFKQFVAASINITISINVSAQDINDLEFPEKLAALLKQFDVNPESFILELTESAILSDTSSALDIFNRLRMKGFLLSIDDFGTGDSSLKRLFQSPFSELKIDRHFVSRIKQDEGALAIVKVCNTLANEFKMHTVAEGVETQEIWDKLKMLGCDIAQGYLIAKPMPVNDFINWANKYTNGDIT